MIERFLQYLQYEKNYSSHTVLSYKNDLLQFVLFLETAEFESDISKVTPDYIRQWIIELMGNGLTARSANRKLSSLKSFYKFLIHEGIIKQNPARNIISPKTNKPLPLFFKEREVNTVIQDIIHGDSFENNRDRLIIKLFYETGIRISELLNIKDTDIDTYTNSLKVIGKRNKERRIPIGKNLLIEIDEYLKLRNREVAQITPYLCVRKDGSKMYSRLVYNVVNKYMSQGTSLSKRSPHVLRHTFASILLNNGADLNAVKELLGHANLSATEVYTHTSFEQLHKIYKQAHPRA